ncbi:tRNA(Ile)(2)-agmatinylcytidine synthase [Haloarcula onubensis]|uniref:tRNA(Ile2) 2-agmatinylcytidine synthetase TiaS n=1 Tax=Haloarcula onubensis TaxID=2950539 RepID=A0ABU2FNW4_9EURY|nr:tRNA(Ile)(2)-agmatinylcytidine synthase [Halomicroarcula sp. S3CR25-11]MDS0282444.1 tRNA(Ile)(2)-agmatinylcytidine synthase [Halomicroarcula sp. S3CR25-11]
MTVVGLDDTDSRETGMCTTYAAAELAERIRDAGGRVERLLLVRLNPAVEHKTRGNAALAVHTDLDADRATALVRATLDLAQTDDPKTNPGAVVADCDPDEVPPPVAEFTLDAIRTIQDRTAATLVADTAGFARVQRGNGRGVVGALSAVGAWAALDDWTYEHIAYREPDRWGSEREVDAESVRAAADSHYPAVWDTVDRASGYPVCVPRTPCPILYGIRGDDSDACRAVADAVESEPVDRRATFVTNQGTDVHLQDGAVGAVSDDSAYRVSGTVAASPETRQGGHVFVPVADDGTRLQCAAFEPTKRFRDRVRALRAGDAVTVCGEVTDGTLKLEKFAVRSLVRTEPATPVCPDCGRTMSSAGRGQGYRCRDCGTSADGKVERPVDRDLEPGWYEVPPVARRHIAKPLVRGGFDGPTHSER